MRARSVTSSVFPRCIRASSLRFGGRVREAREPVFIHTLISKSAVEGCKIRFLVRLAWLDQPESDPLAVRPVKHGLADKTGPVVAPNYHGRPSQRTDTVEYARQVIAADRVLDHNPHRLV